MKDLNSVQFIGRLGQDPEVQYTDRGTARTTFGVATNRSWTDLARLYRLGRVRGAFDVAAVHPYTGRAANVLEVVRRVRLVLDRAAQLPE